MAEQTYSVLRISDEKTMELIDLYQKEECLWNTNIRDYKNKLMRNTAVHRIATTLNIPNFDERHVVMKFKNLRNAYSQEVKKIAKSMGMGEEFVYQPSVFWFDKMNSFIRPHLQAPRGIPRSNLVYIVDGKEDHLIHQNNSEEIHLTEEASGSETEAHETWQSMRNPIPSKRSRLDHDSSSHFPQRRSDFCSTNQTITNSLKELSANLNGLISQKEDYFDSFGKYIAGLLRSLPPQKALEVQPQIVGLIAAAGLQTYCVEDTSKGLGRKESAGLGIGPSDNTNNSRVVIKTELDNNGSQIK